MLILPLLYSKNLQAPNATTEKLASAQIWQEFVIKLVAQTKELDEDIAKASNENFWNMYEPF